MHDPNQNKRQGYAHSTIATVKLETENARVNQAVGW